MSGPSVRAGVRAVSLTVLAALLDLVASSSSWGRPRLMATPLPGPSCSASAQQFPAPQPLPPSTPARPLPALTCAAATGRGRLSRDRDGIAASCAEAAERPP